MTALKSPNKSRIRFQAIPIQDVIHDSLFLKGSSAAVQLIHLPKKVTHTY